MKLVVVGCSPAWHNPGGAQSGYLVEGQGRLLLDCGPGVLARLRAYAVWPDVDAVVITHFHLDHWGDLVPWAFGSRYGPGKDIAPVPELWLPPGGTETLQFFAPPLNAEPIFDAFDVHEYEDDAPFAAAGLEVTPHRLDHYSELTFGLRVQNHNGTLAYSGDTGPSHRLVELAKDADVFLCEATLKGPEPAERGHLSEDEALDAFRNSGAKRLVVIHRPDELPLSPDVERAADGDVITI